MLSLPEIASNIELRADGFWVAKTLSQVSFPAEGNRNCFAVEDSSFWFQHRNACILQMLKRFPPPGTFFDIGGGNGYVAKAIQDAGLDVILIEPGAEGARNAQQRGLRQIIWGTVEDAGLRAGTVTAIGLFDVLEHIEDDLAFLRSLHCLQPAGGRLYITVPAFQALWSDQDRIAGHFRRYTLENLTRKLEASGYAVEFATYFFAFLLLPIWFLRVIPYRLGLGRENESEESVRADHATRSSLAAKIVDKLLRRELARLTAGNAINKGASCLLAVRKIRDE